ncbi:MAG: FAD-binding protein [Propionibacteriales bacterium]|nr:FAD-binding protein [Propionibacteriales bacterium]
MSHEWRNWAGDQACRPAILERPRAQAEVADALERARRAGHVVRVAGAGHSFTDTVLTDGTMLSLERMNRVLDVDRGSGQVRVEAGITLDRLSAALYDHGLALENLGDIAVQSIAGATATGTHGTGARLPNLSANLRSLELTLAHGSVLEVDERSDPEAWRAARVSVGALGVVTAVTLQTVPAFTLEGVEAPRPLDEVLENLDELVDGNEHFEFFTFPHSPLAMTRTNNRVDLAAEPRSPVREWMDDVLLRNHAFHAVTTLGRARSGLIPRLNRLVSRVGGRSHRVDRSYRIFATPRRVRFTEMEYAIPRVHAAEAVRAVRAVSERREYAVSFPLEVRWVAPDDALLSPACGRETCYIAVHMFHGMPWEPYFRAVEEVMDGYDGRPHWGKRHFQDAETLAPRYPGWDRFAAVRARLDPEGRFTNAYVERVLGRS